MEDREQKEGPELGLAEEETGAQKGPGLGFLLRSEREKKGLSHDQVVQVTRLRRHYVEALEKEDWDKLPPPVFVRGFIRSYVKLLGLDEHKALGLYEKSAPKTPTTISFKKFSRRRRGSYYLIGAVLALIVAAGLYIWAENLSTRPTGTEEREARVEMEEKTGAEIPEQGVAEIPIEAGTAEEATISAVEPSEPVEEPGEGAAKEGPVLAARRDLPTAGGQALPGEEGPGEGQPGETGPLGRAEGEGPSREGGEASSGAGVSGPVSGEPAPGAETLTLTGIVKDKTWIRICVDDQDPKEYIFKPGSRPQWKANQGFYVLVGNAAGIDFDFNGEMIENLGEIGRVKRLRLPGDFRGTKCED
ncbi:MAG: helix-turn-helix domain-containing protein [Deltaproteobacteria bacterium]|nr:helix-turn-helix domain-containing protein [Deltaproteobacteria bacterium]